MNRRLRDLAGRLPLTLLVIFVLVNCTSDWGVIAQPKSPPPPPGRPGDPPNIPPGQMPPPGKCRIWYPNFPAGQQPPPGNCEELERQVPPGAWLLRGPLLPAIRTADLRVTQLDMSPDPVREGQGVSFQVTISNLSRYSATTTIHLKDRDEIVSLIHDVVLNPGLNRIAFPQANYRFTRADHCFTVEVDLEQTRRQVDMAKEFCLHRTGRGWTFSDQRPAPLFVEDLRMNPDPVKPGEAMRFTVRLRNDGAPMRADIRIQDRDEVVARLNDATLPRGSVEIQFPFTRYAFQQSDPCFTVLVDIERTPQKVDAVREFCAKPLGWTLKP